MTTQRRGPGSRAGGSHPTRVELLDAAAAIAGDRGIEGLTVAAVTTTAGHAKGTFYVHFDDRTELLTELHRRFHDTLFETIRSSTEGMAAGPDRAMARIEGFLDGCRGQPTVRAMLLEAQSLPEIADLVGRRNDEATSDLMSDLEGTTTHPKETARLLVSATVEVARQELSAGRRLPRLRAALFDLVPANGDSRE